MGPMQVSDQDRTVQRNPRLAGLRCLRCGTRYPLALLHEGCAACRAQGVHVSLRAHYEGPPARTGGGFDPADHLPYRRAFSLGEGRTPLLEVPALAQLLGIGRLSVKDESRNPSGSHKDRMSAAGVSQALDFGVGTLVLASSGNAAVSAAQYARAAGLRCEVASYDGMPGIYARRLKTLGALRHAFPDNEQRWAYVDGRAREGDCLALTNHRLPALGSAPLAIEAYKAIAYECQAEGCVPEHIVVPTARGDLAWGIYAGFEDLRAAGAIERLPRIWAVEPFGRLSLVLEQGAPLHGSFSGNTAQFSTAGNTATYLQWQAATASGGGAVVAGDEEARAMRSLLAEHDLSAELCTAGALAAVPRLRAQGRLAAQAHVLWILTADARCDPSVP